MSYNAISFQKFDNSIEFSKKVMQCKDMVAMIVESLRNDRFLIH